MNIKKMTEENGITLLALVISIVVLMILATVSINALFGADGLIEQASRAKLTTEFTIFIEEKKTYDSKKTYEDSEYLGESLTAGQTTLIYNTQGEDTDGNIQSVIPSMNDDYAGKFEIIKGELLLWASSELEYEVATSLGIKVSPYIIVDGVLLSANTNLGLQTEGGVVTLPERVTEIGQGAFSGVEGLNEVIIPGTVKVIQQDAFSYNTEIEKVTMQYGVKSIGINAFRGCTGLKEVVMPDSVLTIGSEAFRSCTNLTTVQLSNNLTTIPSWVFANCSNLTTINIPTNITRIEGSAFNSCSKLDNIHIPAGVTSIASDSFRDCTSLKNITIDTENTSYTIDGGIIYAQDNSTLIMLASVAEEETITIREGIKSLAGSSLSECTNMKTLNLPSTLNSISGRAFDGLKLLETINFPSGNNTYIADNGYLYSNGGKTLIYVVPTKTEIEINEYVESISTMAINGPNVTELIISDTVKTLSDSIFRTTNNLKKIEIGSGVSSLSSSFKAWSSIPNGLEITIDANNSSYKVEGNLILTKNGEEVVTWINQAQSQEVPEGVIKLQENAFCNFNTTTEIKLSSTLKEIGNSAFQYCTSLTEIKIPNSVESIGTNAFARCSALESIEIDNTSTNLTGSPWGAPKGDRSVIWLK